MMRLPPLNKLLYNLKINFDGARGEVCNLDYVIDFRNSLSRQDDEKGLNGKKISEFVSSKGFDEMVSERSRLF